MTSHVHRLPAGPVALSAIPTDDTPGFEGGKKAGAKALAALGEELSDLQERLWAERGTGSTRRVLLVLQGMDTSGKGGVLRHTVGLVDPQGVKITSFKAPTEEERKHDFLWRIRNAVPAPGYVGVFDRSHYEDVLIVRVHALAEPAVVDARYDQINAFEAELAAQGVVLVKCMLHVSAQEQKERLLARLDSADKYWKFNPGDIDERAFWPEYQRAYETVLERTDSDAAPWYVVPSDRKWYRNWAVGKLLLETLTDLDPRLPEPTYDVAEQRDRLIEEHPIS